MNQIQQAQHAMIDGFFATWALLALWSFWENLQQPGRALWMGLYTVSPGGHGDDKGERLFRCCGYRSVTRAQSVARYGTVTPRLWLLSFVGPLSGSSCLSLLPEGWMCFAAFTTCSS
jgi:hypothetical protein